MAGIVYGLFDSKDHANSAIDYVQEKNSAVDVNAFVHENHFRDEDVQMSGTDALRWSVMGALTVGVGVALIAALILAPRAGMSLGLYEFALVFLGGTIFGVVAGSVAGASVSKEEIRKMANKIGDGRVLVTVDVEHGNPKRIAGLLAERGALEVKAA